MTSHTQAYTQDAVMLWCAVCGNVKKGCSHCGIAANLWKDFQVTYRVTSGVSLAHKLNHTANPFKANNTTVNKTARLFISTSAVQGLTIHKSHCEPL